jgi:2,5-diamino-6-(ribosylamino)-4(3H)-pyrimidinone 5'-phosphate reductase
MDRPEVIVLNSTSIDGKIAISPSNLLLYGDERWKAIEGSGGFNLFEWLKTTHKPQATLEGSGSFVLEGEVPEDLPPYQGDMETLYQDYLSEPIRQKEDLPGWFTVVDGRGRVRWTYTHEYPDEAWKGWFLLVLVCMQAPAPYLAYFQRETVPYLVAGNQRVDLALALQKMKGQLNPVHRRG